MESIREIAYGIDIEKASRQFRRSLYISKDMKKGDVLTIDNLRVIRPGFGLAPKHFETLLEKEINCDVRKGTAMSWNLIN